MTRKLPSMKIPTITKQNKEETEADSASVFFYSKIDIMISFSSLSLKGLG